MTARPLHLFAAALQAALFLVLQLAAIFMLAALAPTTVAAQSTIASQQSALGKWSKTADKAQRWLSLPDRQQEKIPLDQWEQLQVNLSLAGQYALEETEDGNLESRILQAQLAELGPLPTAEKPEEAWIAEQRAQLNEKLAKTQAPLSALRDLHARAGVLSKEVAKVVARRQRIELMTGSASPLMPGLWLKAVREAASLRSGIELSVIRAPERTRWLVAGLIVLGLVSAWLIHRWILRTLRRVENRFATPRVELGAAFAHDMLGIISPLVFVGALIGIAGALTGDLAGLGTLVTSIVGAVLAYVVFRWLGRSLFRPSFAPARVFEMPPEYERRALRASYLLAGVMALDSLASSFHATRPELNNLDAALSFIVVIAASYVVWRLLAAVHEGLVAQAAATGRSDKVQQVILRPVAQIAKAALVVAVVAGTLGFVRLSYYVVTSTIGTLAILFGSVFIFKSVTVASATLFRRGDGTRSTAIQMLPILFGFCLTVLAIPLIALGWGFTVGNIFEFILALRNGFALGDVRISFGGVFRFAIVFVIGYALTRWLQQALQYIVLQRMDVDRGAQAAILTGVGYTGLLLSALVAITAAGLDLSSLAFIAGALSVGIGFGMQPIVANFISGIILLIERPIREGDWIEVGGFTGHVQKIAFRSTHIETFDRQEVIIPNSDLITGNVTNYTYGTNEGRIALPVEVAYDTDMKTARALLLGIAASHPLVLDDPEPGVTMNGFGESSVKLLLLCFVADVNTRAGVISDLNFAILESVQAAKIDIPFPRRDIRILSPDVRTEGSPA